MSYVSTRNNDLKVSAKKAIIKGVSDDGGLFVDPLLGNTKVDLNKIINNSYLDNAKYILSLAFDDFNYEEITKCVDNAYKNSFDHKLIAPVKKVGDSFVLELFHGPTSAFKDVALQLLPQLLKTSLKDSNKKALILTATSGDTGKAALNGFKDIDGIGIIVYYPYQKVSKIQKLQMITQKGKNVKVFAVKGNFDQTQTMVKSIFGDQELKQSLNKQDIILTSANSINIGRLIPQIVYYFDSYKQLVLDGVIKLGDKVSYSVPSGNFGDVLAGYYAYCLGLPVNKFLVASNKNNVLTDFINTGVYDRNREFYQTISPSMDILVSSNLERLLYYLSDLNDKEVKGYMEKLNQKGRYEVSDKIKRKLKALFEAAYYDDNQTKEIINEVYQKEGYLLDPHSAIGYKCAKDLGRGVVISLATASPYKFAVDVLDAINQKSSDDGIEMMKELTKFNHDKLPLGLKELESLEIIHTDVIEDSEMKEVVIKEISRGII